jgi:hypothetical protein
LAYCNPAKQPEKTWLKNPTMVSWPLPGKIVILYKLSNVFVGRLNVLATKSIAREYSLAGRNPGR